MGLSLDKIEQQAPALVSLAKKASFSLSKFGLEDQQAEVEAVFDYSYSMSSEYGSGRMQQLAERVLALAALLDDDGQVPTWFFDSGCQLMGEIDLSNYAGAIDRFTQKRDMGGTEYAPVINAVVKKHREGVGGGLFRRKSGQSTGLPKFVLFFTDGYPMDEAATIEALKEASKEGIFWKFISIGPEIRFLKELDDLEGRVVDNADYVAIGNLADLKEQDLYNKLLTEWPTWLTAARNAGILAP